MKAHGKAPSAEKRIIFSLLLISLFVLFGAFSSAALVEIRWNNNMEPDLAGYTVYCGTTPGDYDYIMDVGHNDRMYINGLEEDRTYYFSITAYDLSGNESAFSREMRCTIPHSGRPLQDMMQELGLSTEDVFYEFSRYVPGSPLTLEGSIFQIHLEIPSGANPGSFLVGIGSGGLDATHIGESPDYSVEINIVPDDIFLQDPALISVPFDKFPVVVERYNERTESWEYVDDVHVSGDVVSFTTQVLGRFKVHQPIEREDADNREASSGNGGGGCFISTSVSSFSE